LTTKLNQWFRRSWPRYQLCLYCGSQVFVFKRPPQTSRRSLGGVTY
jgi:hypothetical protein